MANLLKLLPLILHFLLLSSATFLPDVADDDSEATDVYILDAPFSTAPRLKGRYSTTVKKGEHCDASYNVCNGVSANNGTSLLYCCKNHCRNVLRNFEHCGSCGHGCRFGQRCCGGVCTDVVYNNLHCGECDKACKPGVKCDFGSCGYA